MDTATGATDDLAAAVDAILHDHRQHVSELHPAPGICISRCADSIPRWPCGAYRAAAALKAALKKADDWDAESDRLDAVADNPGCDEDARPVISGEAQGYSDCAADLREAITAALTGKETGDG